MPASAGDPGQIRAAVDVLGELADVQRQVAQGAREMQAVFDATDTAQGAAALERYVQALDKVGTWIRSNSDVFPFLLALIQATAGNLEPPP